MNNVELEEKVGPTPKVLLIDTNRWALSARLAIGLSDAGCHVSAVCPMPGHALSRTRAARKMFPYSGISPVESLVKAIQTVDPDIIIPCCERSLGHLHELHAQCRNNKTGDQRLGSLIERSLGDPSSYPVVTCRYELLKLASEEGVCVPRMSRVDSPEQLEAWLAQEPFPWVLKADGTWGGGGVKIVHAEGEVSPAFNDLARMFRLRRAVKRLFVNRDSFELRSWWKRKQHEVSVQAYIQGRPANCAVVSWKGRVLAGLGVEVVRSDGATGPANVVRVVNNPEMMFAAERIAARLHLTGFFGLDFVIEEGSSNAYLIEMNPRTTPLCHFRLGRDRDMVASLRAQLSGQPYLENPPITKSELIAYFPQPELSDNSLLHDCFYDVPEGEPELVQELLRPFPSRTLLFRFFTWLSRRRNGLHKGRERGQYSSDQVKDWRDAEHSWDGSAVSAADSGASLKTTVRSDRL
jgi:ATP-grasp domain